MTQSRTIGALLLTATVLAYAVSHQSDAASPAPPLAPANTAPVRVPVADYWMPPSFDVETAPAEELVAVDPRSSDAFER